MKAAPESADDAGVREFFQNFEDGQKFQKNYRETLRT